MLGLIRSAFTRMVCRVSEYEASEEMREGISKTVESVCVYSQNLVGCCHELLARENQTT